MITCRQKLSELSPRILARLNQQTFIASARLAELWRRQGGEPVCFAVEDEGETVGILVGAEFGTGMLRRFQSMPDGLYLRPVVLKDGVDAATVASALFTAIDEQKYARIYLNDYHGHFDSPAGYKRVEQITHLVDISEPGWFPPDKKLQSEIRKAEREKIRLQEFSLNRHFDDFLELMNHTEKRHDRRPKYSQDFYRDLAKVAMTDQRVRWIYCEHDSQPAASHIYFAEGELLLQWQVFFDKRYSFLKPNQFITFTIAREMATRGCRLLNLGASPEGADSLVDYKAKWGAEEYPYACWLRSSLLGRFL